MMIDSRAMKGLFAALAVSLVALHPALAATEDRVAVPIRAPQVETPIETAGSGLAPEVQVRVHVDVRGRVGKVEIGEINPSSEFDELFGRMTRETLSGWRYAPAVEDGQPAEATLEWTIQFPSRDAAPEKSPTPRFEGSSGQAKEDLWDQVLRMTDERRIKLLEESGARAERHLDAEHRREQSSNRFLTFTDHPDPKVATKLAGNFEATYNVVGQLLAPVIVPLPDATRFSPSSIRPEARTWA